MSSREEVALWNDGVPSSAIAIHLNEFEEALAQGFAARENRETRLHEASDSLGSDSSMRLEPISGDCLLFKMN